MRAVIFSLCVFFNVSACLAEVNSGDILRAVITLTVPSSSTPASAKVGITSTKTKVQPAALTKADLENMFPMLKPYESPRKIEPKTTRKLEYPAIANEKYDVTHSNLGRKLRAYWDDELYGTKAPEYYSTPEQVWYGVLYYVSWIPVAIVFAIDFLLLILMFIIFGVILWFIDGCFWAYMSITGLGILLGTRKS